MFLYSSTEIRMRSWRYIIFIMILHSKQILSGKDLPKGANIVERCPEPKNKTAWTIASKRLGCTHSGQIPWKQSQVFHCLPSSLLNEYVEFCGITAPMDQGNCPVFQYVNTSGRNRSPISWNCSTFSTGCPSEFYYSRDVYKYPECLNLDKSHRCFTADTRCMNDTYSTSTIEYDIMNSNAGQKWDLFYVVLGLLIFIGIVSIVLVAIILKLLCHIRGKQIRKKNKYRENELKFGTVLEQQLISDRHGDETESMLKGIPDSNRKLLDTEIPVEQNKEAITKQERGELIVKEETDMHAELYHLHSRCDFRNAYSYDCLQEKIVKIFSSIQKLVELPAFDCHIRQDLHKMGNIKNYLEWRKHDFLKTYCAIVVAGETSSGKSSIINLIIGKDVVHTDSMATTRVCRIRYSEKIRVSALDKKGKELVQEGFNNEEELIEKMKDLATTDDHQIECIDVWFPVPILKGNIIIVDMPGNGDTEQDDVAQKMMEYLPNAVAFIYVVNVANAGGFKDDRLLHIIKRVRESMNQTYCLNPEDAIFLLNKWDAVPQKRNLKKGLYEEMKAKVHGIWEDVKDSNIMKFASAKVHEEDAYKVEFDKFHAILKEVIAKNEFKRIKVHLGFINSFVDDCDANLNIKLKCARQSREETIKEFDQLCRDLQIITKKRKEAYSSLQQSVDQFLEETSEDLYQYIHSSEFRSLVLHGIEKYKRFTVGKELDSRIEKATLSWQEENIGQLFERKILQTLTDKFVKIHESLHEIKNKMKGFTSPFDIEDKVGSVLVSLFDPSGTAVAGSTAMMYMSLGPRAASAVVAAGVVTDLVLTGLVALDVLDNFETATKNAYKARIDKITKEKIREELHKTYEERLKNVIKSYLEGELEKEIEDLLASVNSTKSKIALNKTEEASLLDLSSEILKIRNRLQEFKNIEIKLD